MESSSLMLPVGEPAGFRDFLLQASDRLTDKRYATEQADRLDRLERSATRFRTLFPDRVYGVDLARETITCDQVEFSGSRITSSSAFPTTDLCVVTDCTCGSQVSAGVVRNAATAGEAIKRISLAMDLRKHYEQGKTDLDVTDLLLCPTCSIKAEPDLDFVDTVEDRLLIALREAVLGWIREDARNER